MSAVPWVPVAALREALHVEWAARDAVNPTLECVNLQTRERHLVAVATDGVSIARLAIPLGGRVAKGALTLPLHRLAEVKRTLAAETSDIALANSVGPLAGMAWDGSDYPAVDKIDRFFGDRAGDIALTVRRKDLLSGLGRMLRGAAGVRIRVRSRAVELREPTGDFKPIVCAARASRDGGIYINRQFLARALRWLRGEFVTIHFGATKESKIETPVILFGHGDGSRAVAIMELRP